MSPVAVVVQVALALVDSKRPLQPKTVQTPPSAFAVGEMTFCDLARAEKKWTNGQEAGGEI